MAIFQCSADVIEPIMDRISLVFQWLESKKMHVWKTKYTIEKLEAASGDLLNMIKDVEVTIENAKKNGWSPKEQAKGWAEQGRKITELAEEVVTKYKVGCTPDPSSGAIRILLHSPCDTLWMRGLNGEAVMRFDNVKEHKAKGEIYEEGRFNAVATNSVEYEKVRILAIVAALLIAAGALFFMFLRDEYSCEAIESKLASVEHTVSSEVQHNSIEEVEKQRLADLDKVKVCAFTQYRHLARSQSYQSAPVMIRVTAPRHSSRLRVPIDLVILLDISSADTYESLNQAMGGAMFVIHNLEPHDRLSILLASETRQAHLLFPLTHMSNQQKKIAKCIISSLSLHEHIDIVSFEPGKIIGAAYQILEERSDKNPVSSIMILTDGFDASRVGAEKLSGNYPVYTFGIGSDHDPCWMYELATGGRGTYSFADPKDPKSIRDAMALCIGGLTSIVAQRVKIYIDSAHRDVVISRITCGAYDKVVEDGMIARSITVDNLCDSEEKNFLIYVKVPAEERATSIFTRTPKTTKLFTVKATYYCPLTNADVNTDPIEVSVERPDMVRRRSQADSNNISVEVASEVIRAHVLERVKKIWMSSNKETSCSSTVAAGAAASNLESSISSEMNKLRDFIKDNEDAMVAKDRLDDLMTDLERMQDTKTGLHYMLSWLSSYQLQRAAIPGSTSKGSFTFRTTCMQNMIDSVNTATTVYYQDVQDVTDDLLEKNAQSRMSDRSRIQG